MVKNLPLSVQENTSDALGLRGVLQDLTERSLGTAALHGGQAQH